MSTISILGDYEYVYVESEYYAALKKAGHDIKIHHEELKNDLEIIDEIHDAEVVVLMRERTHLNKNVLSNAPNLSLISQTGKGLNHLDQEFAEKQGIEIRTTEGVSSQSVVELTIGMMIGCARQFSVHQLYMREALWEQTPGFELKGKRLGLIGFGHIGKGVSQIANSIGMDVVAWRPRGDKANEQEDYQVRILSLEEVLSTSDVVSIHLRLLPEFRQFLNRDRLRLLKKGAILINTSRGELVDEQAIATLLENHHLLGAGIDTFTTEPLTDNPFKNSTNTILTPHIGYVTYDVLQRFADASLKNVIDWYNINDQVSPPF
ncbi:NAD(P)-dependent oxidoreductase [Halalkalibacter alkalisediminis]|uniref:NAD(P)-dependent oxidoreductase n=1 Tax=Halalkalibacter alkalisediminis TaxID=935616 RepID=A0ABV6NH15_9BACI|nr:NAD(P)-dependent oxidoreductase [Halalkalibacter alkalisediminis]